MDKYDDQIIDQIIDESVKTNLGNGSRIDSLKKNSFKKASILSDVKTAAGASSKSATSNIPGSIFYDDQNHTFSATVADLKTEHPTMKSQAAEQEKFRQQLFGESDEISASIQNRQQGPKPTSLYQHVEGGYSSSSSSDDDDGIEIDLDAQLQIMKLNMKSSMHQKVNSQDEQDLLNSQVGGIGGIQNSKVAKSLAKQNLIRNDFTNPFKDQAMFEVARAMATKDILFMDDLSSNDLNLDFKQLDTIENAKKYLKLDKDDEVIKYCNYIHDKYITCAKKYQDDIDIKYSQANKSGNQAKKARVLAKSQTFYEKTRRFQFLMKLGKRKSPKLRFDQKQKAELRDLIPWLMVNIDFEKDLVKMFQEEDESNKENEDLDNKHNELTKQLLAFKNQIEMHEKQCHNKQYETLQKKLSFLAFLKDRGLLDDTPENIEVICNALNGVQGNKPICNQNHSSQDG